MLGVNADRYMLLHSDSAETTWSALVSRKQTSFNALHLLPSLLFLLSHIFCQSSKLTQPSLQFPTHHSRVHSHSLSYFLPLLCLAVAWQAGRQGRHVQNVLQ